MTGARAQSIDYGDLEQLFNEPVTTSATGKPQRASQVPADLEIITAEQIRRSGYDNLPDTLRLVPGVDVRRYGFASADVSIRGYNTVSNPRLLVLVNGQQVYFDDYGRTQWYALPVELDEIRQIEVVKGPNSALYGFNAVAGVVNIVTYDPRRDQVNSVTTRAGTQSYAAASAVSTVRIGDSAGVRLSAGGFHAHDFTTERINPLASGTPVAPLRGSLAADGRFQIAPGIEGQLSGSLVSLRSYEPVGSPSYAADYYHTNAVRSAVTAETGFGVLSFNAYRNHLNFSYGGAAGHSGLSEGVTVVQASDLVKLGTSHTVRLGFEFRDNSQTLSAASSQIGYQLFAANFMWDWEITPSLSMTNAVRLDYLALNASGPLFMSQSGRTQSDYDRRRVAEVSFNSGLVWRATDHDTLRLTLARGLQAPSLTAFGYQAVTPPSGFVPGFAFVGSANLRPSAVLNTELGYDRDLPGLASTVRTAVFAQRTDDVISDPFSAQPSFTGNSLVFSAANVGHSAAVGGEIGVRGEARGWRWDASYAYESISDHLNRSSTSADFQHGTPTHVVRLGGGYRLGRLEADLQGLWQSRYQDLSIDSQSFATKSVQVPNFVQLDGRVGFEVAKGLTIALTATQFNASRLIQTGSRPVERRAILSATARF